MRSDYFEMLGIPKGLTVDTVTLRNNYFAKQSQFHPDKNTQSAEFSAELNNAYGILKDKYKRLEYIVRGQKLEACASLLEEMLELREDPQTGVEKARAEIEKLFSDSDILFKENKLDKLAQNFVRIKYLRKFLEDVTANT